MAEFPELSAAPSSEGPKPSAGMSLHSVQGGALRSVHRTKALALMVASCFGVSKRSQWDYADMHIVSNVCLAISIHLIADYDVFRLMAPYLDPHMLFPVLSFLQELNVRAL
jgi:hypothetical protein